MSDIEKYIFGDNFLLHTETKGIVSVFQSIIGHSQLDPFINKYKNKIRARITSQYRAYKNKPEDISKVIQQCWDLLAELKVAALLICNGYNNVQYEKFKPGPDLTVKIFGTDINIEVTRIRQNLYRAKIDQRIDRIIQEVEQCLISYDISFFFRKGKDGEFYFDEKYDNQIIEFAKSKIHDIEIHKDINHCNEFICSMNEIEEGLGKIKFTLKYRDRPICLEPDLNIHRGNEFKTFGNKLRKKINQVRDYEPNIIFIVSDSDSHNDHDMRHGIDQLVEQLLEGNKNFFKRRNLDINKFENKFQYISGVVYRDNWIPVSKKERIEYKRNVIMRNKFNVCHESQLDERIFSIFGKLDFDDEIY